MKTMRLNYLPKFTRKSVAELRIKSQFSRSEVNALAYYYYKS